MPPRRPRETAGPERREDGHIRFAGGSFVAHESPLLNDNNEALRSLRGGAAQGVLQRHTVEAQEEPSQMQWLRHRGERTGAVHEGSREVGGRRVPHLLAAASAGLWGFGALHMLHEESVRWLHCDSL